MLSWIARHIGGGGKCRTPRAERLTLFGRVDVLDTYIVPLQGTYGASLTACTHAMRGLHGVRSCCGPGMEGDGGRIVGLSATCLGCWFRVFCSVGEGVGDWQKKVAVPLPLCVGSGV